MTDPDKRFEAIIEKLRANYYKITPQRLAIAEILAKSTGHPSVEDIYEQVGKDYPSMSLATVYRNVMLMKSLGEILELGFPDGSNRYDGNKPYPHPHVICIRCGKIIEPHLTSLRDMTKEVIQKTNFTVLTHQLNFFGKCGDCK
ncbi:MAG: Fur family transcriptional regulator [Desulfosalsimonas sp.]